MELAYEKMGMMVFYPTADLYLDEEKRIAQASYGRVPGVRSKERKILKAKEDYEKDFFELIEKGEIDAVEEFEDMYPMYFVNPQQLIDIFSKLED